MRRGVTALTAILAIYFSASLSAQAQGIGSRLADGGISVGQATNSGGMQTFLGINAVQGGSRFIGSSSAVGTSIQGQPFTLFDGVRRPFVTGVVPNVASPPLSSRLIAEQRAEALRSRLARSRALPRQTSPSRYVMRPAKSAREIFAESSRTNSDADSNIRNRDVQKRANRAFESLGKRK